MPVNSPDDVDHDREYIFQYEFPVADHPGVVTQEHDDRPHPEVQFLLESSRYEHTDLIGVRVFDRRTQVNGDFDVIVCAKHDSGEYAYVEHEGVSGDRKVHVEDLEEAVPVVEDTLKSYRDRMGDTVTSLLNGTEVNIS